MPRLSYPLIAYPLIAIFWLTMWALLLRTELRPQGASLRAVPLPYVANVLFHHERDSELFIRADGTVIGHLRISPHIRPADQGRTLGFSGSLHLRLPNNDRQRINWDGSLEMDHDLNAQLFKMGFTIRDASSPPEDQSEITVVINPVAHSAGYSWKNGGHLEDEQSFALDQSGLQQLMGHLGVDPGLVRTTIPTQASMPVITAQQSTLEIHHERVDSFLVTIEQNGQTLAEMHISQLGQILQAKTLIGWTFDVE
jgi:hypothetical protein